MTVESNKNKEKAMPQIKFIKTDEKAITPTKSYSSAACVDLYTTKKVVLAGNTTKAISTGIAMEIPENWFGKVFDRSGLALNTTLFVKAGVIDSDFRGEIMVILGNYAQFPTTIDAGQKIAQMAILPVYTYELKEVKKLSKTSREDKGFGSSG